MVTGTYQVLDGPVLRGMQKPSPDLGKTRMLFRRAHNSENVHRDTGRKSDLGRRVSDSLVTDQQSLRFRRLEMIVKVCTGRKTLNK